MTFGKCIGSILLFGVLLAGVLSTISCITTAAAAPASETCFKSGENTDGMNKTCFYRCVSGSAAITISRTQLCPLSIER